MSAVKFHWTMQFDRDTSDNPEYSGWAGYMEGNFAEPENGEMGDHLASLYADDFFLELFRSTQPGDYLEIERVQ